MVVFKLLNAYDSCMVIRCRNAVVKSTKRPALIQIDGMQRKVKTTKILDFFFFGKLAFKNKEFSYKCHSLSYDKHNCNLR